ncbi:uncharacterized protein BJ171DRAFT_598927 [Polychytrium aggregatum]|uniref:uncharacterized protein n=1 Tax=Polychytrium aggregatum TaxID=110093 RepID=UPI0022FE81EE|nr:uncharacterized protein BJ171DRAFT_598927 [Polychytrium aggregatum]KAI9204917.1 hypothetical protein BJ171DRAFT_598927 [Polychytrium aggregatum]
MTAKKGSRTPQKRRDTNDSTATATPLGRKRASTAESLSPQTPAKRVKEEISVDEAKLYDRQIRLWGIEAQQRMRNTKALVLGMCGLTLEICKNLTLAGLGSITIVEDKVATDRDLGSLFFLSESDLGRNKGQAVLARLRDLNPRVELEVLEVVASEQADSFFEQFGVICTSIPDLGLMLRLDKICRDKNISFWAGGVSGMFGYFFTDLKEHQYAVETKSITTKSDEIAKVTRSEHTEAYQSLEHSLQKKWGALSKKELKRTSAVYFGWNLLLKFQSKFGRLPQETDADVKEMRVLRDAYVSEHQIPSSFLTDDYVRTWARMAALEVMPVCAIVGGLLAQEILKVVSKKELPFNNYYCYYALEGVGYVMKVES